MMMRKAEQLVFDLPVETGFGRDDFFVSGANKPAVRAIEHWLEWPLGKFVLHGPQGAGKTHLAQIWAEVSGAQVVAAMDLDQVAALAKRPICVEDVPSIAGDHLREAALFHLHNLLAQAGYSLLMTGRGVPTSWGIVLPDLASRIDGSQGVALGMPDDGLLSAVLIKLCADRQLLVEPDVVDYIVRHAERSFAAVHELVRSLDRLSLQRKKPIKQRMVAEILEYQDALRQETLRLGEI
jgi:chromosomal replication initiation ATPase DnaA